MEELFFIENGKKRRAAKVICPVCEVEFLTRLAWKDKLKFCSVACKGKNDHLDNSTEVSCSWCQQSFRRRNSRFGKNKTDYHFCCRACKDEAQKLGGIKDIMPSHFGTRTYPVGISDHKEYDLDIGKCCSCPENRYYLLTVHHIDGNRKNNDKSNLEVVCYNCHAVRHLDFKNDRWHVNYKKLTDRSKLEEM